MQAEVLVILLSLMAGVELKWSDESTLYENTRGSSFGAFLLHGEILISVIKIKFVLVRFFQQKEEKVERERETRGTSPAQSRVQVESRYLARSINVVLIS